MQQSQSGNLRHQLPAPPGLWDQCPVPLERGESAAGDCSAAGTCSRTPDCSIAGTGTGSMSISAGCCTSAGCADAARIGARAPGTYVSYEIWPVAPAKRVYGLACRSAACADFEQHDIGVRACGIDGAAVQILAGVRCWCEGFRVCY